MLPNGIGVFEAVATAEANPKSYEKQTHQNLVTSQEVASCAATYFCDKVDRESSGIVTIAGCSRYETRNWIVYF